jgi:hypothetical protein
VKALFSLLIAMVMLGVSPAPVCDSGIQGRVILGPLCPVERPGMVCSRPLSATLRVDRSDGSFMATVHSDAQGRFALGVPEGSYTVVPLQLRPNSNLPYGRSVTVNVEAHAFTWVDIYYDTGIR